MGSILKDKTVGLGFIIRDSDGESLLAGSLRIRGRGCTTLMEGLALRHALVTAMEAGVSHFDVEGDNKNLMTLLANDESQEEYIGLIIDDIRDLAKSSCCAKFNYVPRLANTVAHALAHLQLDIGDSRVWLEDLLYDIYSLVLRDVGRWPII